MGEITALRDPQIALCQLYIPKSSTPASQFQRIAKFTQQAAQDGADIVVFPEMCLGHVPGVGATMDERAAFSEACAVELENFQELAKELSINVIPGSISSAVPSPSGQGLSHCNTSYYIDRTGTIRLTYHKVNLWGSERECFTPGTQHEVYETEEFGKIGLLICWDLAFPEAFRSLLRLGARIIFIPTLWKLPDCGPVGLSYNPSSESVFINSTIACRAFEQNCCVVFCNTGAPTEEGLKEERKEYFGNSQICLPFHGPVIKLDAGEQCVTTEVKIGRVLDDAEEVWSIRSYVSSPQWYLKGA